MAYLVSNQVQHNYHSSSFFLLLVLNIMDHLHYSHIQAILSYHSLSIDSYILPVLSHYSLSETIPSLSISYCSEHIALLNLLYHLSYPTQLHSQSI